MDMEIKELLMTMLWQAGNHSDHMAFVSISP